jgi:hypothetical protein
MLRLFEQCLQLSRGAVDEERFDTAGQGQLDR